MKLIFHFSLISSLMSPHFGYIYIFKIKTLICCGILFFNEYLQFVLPKFAQMLIHHIISKRKKKSFDTINIIFILIKIIK